MFSGFRTIIVALAAVLAAGLSSAARADSGTVRINFVKAGWIIGGSVGSGTLSFRGRTYPLSIGGLSYGLTFGGWAPLSNSLWADYFGRESLGSITGFVAPFQLVANSLSGWTIHFNFP